jgi:uncharacterized protein YndB with AHSA1/START domain
MARQKNPPWLRSLTFAALGFGAGIIFGGGKLVRVYDWQFEWALDAPLSQVYQALSNAGAFLKWWPSMGVQQVIPLPTIRGGRKVLSRVKQPESVGSMAPPFRLTSIWTEREGAIPEQERSIRAMVSGNLAGVMDIFFSGQPKDGTRVVFHWSVRCSHPLVNVLGFFLEPVFHSSMAQIMPEGEAGLRRYCQQCLPPVASGEGR